MELVIVLIVVALTFGFCFLMDKGFSALFRSKKQHRSGKAVRHSKRYAAFGLIASVLGIALLFAGGAWYMYVGGAALILIGIALVLFYISFGIYYDDRGFLIQRPFQRDMVYTYDQIVGQNAYAASASIMVELSMNDGRTIQLQSQMTDMVSFMDYAFSRWAEGKGYAEEDCPFHNRQEYIWFPPAGEV